MTFSRTLFPLLFSFFFFLVSPAGAQWHVVRENAQKSFPRTIPAGNYSGITRLHDDVYAVVSDKSDSALYFRFRIQVDSLTGDVKLAECLGPSVRIAEGSLDHEAVALVRDSLLVVASEALFRFAAYPIGNGTAGVLASQSFASLPVTSPFATFVPFPTTCFYPNYGYESLTYDALRDCLWTVSESTMPMDGQAATPSNGGANVLRLFAFRPECLLKDKPASDTVCVASYVYRMDPPSTTRKARVYAMGVSELCTLPDGRLLVLEREAFVPKKKIGAFCHCKLFVVDPAVSALVPLSSPLSPDVPCMQKTLLTEWRTSLTLLGRSFANYEGMCLGPCLKDGSQVLLLVSDSQDRYGGVLRDWIKSIVIAP